MVIPLGVADRAFALAPGKLRSWSATKKEVEAVPKYGVKPLHAPSAAMCDDPASALSRDDKRQPNGRAPRQE